MLYFKIDDIINIPRSILSLLTELFVPAASIFTYTHHRGKVRIGLNEGQRWREG